MTWFLNDAYINAHLDQWKRENERRARTSQLPRRERGSALRRLRELLAARGRRAPESDPVAV